MQDMTFSPSVHSVVPEADFPCGSGFVSRQASIPDGFKGKEAAAGLFGR
jgi:hypothetical protein